MSARPWWIAELHVLCSGGKDSCYNMMLCTRHGHKIVALANLLPAEEEIDELDSYMYQTVGHQLVAAYAECMGLPLLRRRLMGTAKRQVRRCPGCCDEAGRVVGHARAAQAADW